MDDDLELESLGRIDVLARIFEGASEVGLGAIDVASCNGATLRRLRSTGMALGASAL